MGKVSRGAFLGTAGKSVMISKHYNLETVLKCLKVQGYRHKKPKKLNSNRIVAFDVKTVVKTHEDVSCVNGALATLLTPPPHLYQES